MSPIRVDEEPKAPLAGLDPSLILEDGKRHHGKSFAIGALALLIIVLLAGLFIGRRQVSALATENTVLRQRNVDLAQEKDEANRVVEELVSQQPSCDPYSEEIQELRRSVNQGQFSLVEGMANLYLSDTKRPVCADAKQALAKLAYSTALNDLFLAPVDDHAATERWGEAERRADAHGLPATDRMPPMLVVTQAYNAGLWELSRTAFLKAWDDGSVDQQSLKQVRLYYSILRNWGKALVDEQSPDQHRAGLMALRTASQISRYWGLSQGEAYQDLAELLGPENEEWPSPDLSDPVLAAARK